MEEGIENENYNYPQENGMSDTFLALTIGVKEELKDFKIETLRREKLVVDVKSKKKRYVPIADGVKPVCNDLGIAEIMGMVRSRVTTFGRLTKKTEDQIMRDMFQFHNTLIETFTKRADDWEMEEEMIKTVLEECLSLVQDIVFASKDGFTAMNMRSQYQRSETANITQEGGSKKILGMNVN